MTNNNYNVQTDEQIARDILSILPDAPEDPNKEPTESPKVFMLPIRQLKSFQNHPFKIVDNDEMKDLMHSIRDYGVMTPITVYVNKNAEYEIVSGHRRVFACKMLKMTEIPAIIMDYDRDQAVLAMVDSNLHREKLLPSEKGFAYKMKLEALKNQHREMEFEMQMRSDEILAKEQEVLELKRKYFGEGGEWYKKREALLKPIQDEIYTAIQDIAADKRFDIVKDRSADPSLIYMSSKLDISDQVLEKLGAK